MEFQRIFKIANMQISSLINFAFILIFLCLPNTVADYYSNLIYSNTSLIGGANIAMPGCSSKCGDLIVPYPFGIGVNATCSISPFFEINCDSSFDPPKAFLGYTEHEVLDISETKIRIKNQLARSCYDDGIANVSVDIWMDLSGTPFSFSNENKLTVVGCDDVALLAKDTVGEWLDFVSSCVAVCSKPGDLSYGFCSGIGCCEASIPKGLQFIYATMTTLNEHRNVNFTTCGYVFLAEQNSYTFNVSDVTDSSFVSKITETVPFVLDWVISNKTCNQIRGSSEITCQGHSECVDSGSILGGYRCNCSQGYQGNPYISPGRYR